MSFLFKMKGVEEQKTRKVMMIINFVQAGTGWFMFIACIMLGNLKQRINDFSGSLDTTQKTYNPVLALFAIIGILQTLFSAFLALILLGKLPFVNRNRILWLNIIHYGLIVQFGFVFFVCLQASTESTIFAALNDSNISQFSKIDSSNSNYKYYEAFVVYSRYLTGWAVLEFVICLPIALLNIYAFHNKHVAYDHLDQAEKEEITVQPTPSLSPNPYTQPNTIKASNTPSTNFNPSILIQPPPPARPLEEQMIPK